jgi:hypothetical protein
MVRNQGRDDGHVNKGRRTALFVTVDWKRPTRSVQGCGFVCERTQGRFWFCKGEGGREVRLSTSLLRCSGGSVRAMPS